MTAVLLTPPARKPVELVELKQHARVDITDDDDLLQSYLNAAIAQVEEVTGLGLILQTWTQTFPGFGTGLRLAKRPLRAIGSPPSAVSLSYLDVGGVIQALPSSEYRVTGIGDDRWPGSSVRPWFGTSWPTVYDDQESVTAVYTVGYGTTATSVPPPLRLAILMTASNWYSFREDYMLGGSPGVLPMSSIDLLRQWRAPALA